MCYMKISLSLSPPQFTHIIQKPDMCYMKTSLRIYTKNTKKTDVCAMEWKAYLLLGREVRILEQFLHLGYLFVSHRRHVQTPQRVTHFISVEKRILMM